MKFLSRLRERMSKNRSDYLPLSDIQQSTYDRVEADAFVTKKDHAQEVLEIQEQILGLPMESLSTSQRVLIDKIEVNEVRELGKLSGHKKHRRQLLLFSDIAVVCKKLSSGRLMCKNVFSLSHVLHIKFRTPKYKHGVQLCTEDGSIFFQFNCASDLERDAIFQHLEDIQDCLELLESEQKPQDSTRHEGELATNESNLTVEDVTLRETEGHFINSVSDEDDSSQACPSGLSSDEDIDSGFTSRLLTPVPSLNLSFSEPDEEMTTYL